MSNLTETLTLLYSFKVEDIVHIDVTGVSSLFDHMVVCTARSSQHAKTVAERAQYHFKPELAEIPKTDGQNYGEWIAVDLGDVILHIMLAQTREKYKLEQLWHELKNATND